MENNYENFAHELSNSYWSPMTNTLDLASNNSSHENDRKQFLDQTGNGSFQTGNSRLQQVQVDLNSTNSDSQSQRSSVTGSDGHMTMTSTHPNAGMALVNAGMAMATSSSLPSTTVGSLSVNSRPSSSVSPERRLDSMVLGSESITNLSQFIDPGFIESPGFKQMARPIPTFNSFGHHEHEHVHLEQPEVHRAMPVFAPTPSPGSSEPDINGAPPLPARTQQNGHPNGLLPNGHPNGHNLHIQQSSQQQQPHSLPFFPFHQFPGRSVKPMRKSFLFFPELYFMMLV